MGLFGWQERCGAVRCSKMGGQPACEGRQQLVLPERRFTHYYYYPYLLPYTQKCAKSHRRLPSSKATGRPPNKPACLRKTVGCTLAALPELPILLTFTAAFCHLPGPAEERLRWTRDATNIQQRVSARPHFISHASSYLIPTAHTDTQAGDAHSERDFCQPVFAKAENHDHHPRTTTTSTTSTTNNSSPCTLPPATRRWRHPRTETRVLHKRTPQPCG